MNGAIFLIVVCLGITQAWATGPYGAAPVLSHCGRALLSRRSIELIEDQRTANAQNNFVVARGINSYDLKFDKQLLNRIRSLSQHSRVTLCDWGAGTARMLREVYDLARRERWKHPPRLVAISDKLPQVGDKSQLDYADRDKLNAENDRRMKIQIEDMQRAIDFKELEYHLLDANKAQTLARKATVATDFYGVLSYAEDLTQALENVFNNLEVGGELYVHADFNATEIYENNLGSRKIGLDTLLTKTPGLKVERLGSDSALKITKTQETVSFPILQLQHWDLNSPPTRIYRVLN